MGAASSVVRSRCATASAARCAACGPERILATPSRSVTATRTIQTSSSGTPHAELSIRSDEDAVGIAELAGLCAVGVDRRHHHHDTISNPRHARTNDTFDLDCDREEVEDRVTRDVSLAGSDDIHAHRDHLRARVDLIGRVHGQDPGRKVIDVAEAHRIDPNMFADQHRQREHRAIARDRRLDAHDTRPALNAISTASANSPIEANSSPYEYSSLGSGVAPHPDRS